MSNILTISLLDSLPKPELITLDKFLKSPFPPKKKFVYTLFLTLTEAGCAADDTAVGAFGLQQQPAAGQSQPQTDDPAIGHFGRVFPNQPFVRHKWNKALSELNACIEDFIAIRRLQKDTNLYGQALSEALYEQDNESLFQRATNAMLTQKAGAARLEKTEDWQIRFRSRKQVITYHKANRLKLPDTTLEDLGEDLDIYYCLSKLQLACNQVMRGQYHKSGLPDQDIQTLLNWAKGIDPAGKSALLSLYRLLLPLLSGLNPDFAPFFTCLKAQGPRLFPRELETLVRFAFSYFIRHYRAGDTQAIPAALRLFDWYKQHGGWSSAVAEEFFLNYGVLLAKTHQVKELNTFLELGNKSLPEERRAQAVFLLEACRDFHRSAFDQAADALHRVTTRHPRYAMLYHSIRVRNTYELLQRDLADLNQLHLCLQSFDEFLQRQKLFNASFCQSCRALTWFIRKITPRGPNRRINKSKLREEINRRQPAIRDWVEDVFNRLPG